MHVPRICIGVFTLALLLGNSVTAGSTMESSPLYDIPQLQHIIIDARMDDWGPEGGLRVDVLTPVSGELLPLRDYDVRMRLAWNRAGLLVLIIVQDDRGMEHPDEGQLWAMDSVELFLAPRRGANDWCQWVISPGLDPEYPKLRWHAHHSRKDEALKGLPADVTAARSMTGNGYILEALLPWGSLAIDPQIGREVGFQILANDQDGPDEPKYRHMWYPGQRTSRDSHHMHRLRLAEHSGRDVLVLTRHDYDMERMEPFLTVIGPPEQKGRELTLIESGKVVARVMLAVNGSGRAVARLALPVVQAGKRDVRFAMELNGVPVEELRVPAAVALVPRMLKQKEELRERFGMDRPWDDMADAPPLIRRHRGMVAEALRWVEAEGTEDGEEQLLVLSRAAEMIVALDRGEDYLGGLRNEFWSAYYSSADGSGQIFVTIVPADLDASKAYPLVVQLHGRGELSKPRWDLVHEGMEYLEVWPWGRGSNGYMALGEDDVLRVIEYMKRWYRIDPDRVYVTGCSMGGSGTWLIAARHPDLFAAAAPLYGGASDLPLENLRHVPVFNQHGAKDWLVPVDLSRFAVNALEKMGYVVAHKEYPEHGHNVPEWGVAPWMLRLRRPDLPPIVTYTCETPDQGRAYWLYVRRLVDPHRFVRVVVHVSGRGEGQLLTLLAPNVEVLELDVERMPVDRDADLLVQVDETFLELGAPLPPQLFVIQDRTGWSLANQWSPPTSEVRPYRSGAAAELYTGEPLMIVYGAKGDVRRTELLREAALRLARFAGAGWEMPIGRFPVKADHEVTREDMTHFNLLLLGTARDNALVARILPELPLTIDDRGELIAGDRKPVSLDGAGIRMVYYNPLAPQRLIFWVGMYEDGEAAREWLMDPYQTLTGSEGIKRLDQSDLVVETIRGPIRRQMQFTHNWRWRRVHGDDRPLPESMASTRQMTLARLRVMRRTAGTDFALGWGSDAHDQAYDPRWFTLADMAVSNTPGQTLIGSLTGEELIEIHKRWVVKDELTVVPAYEPKDIDPKRIYRIAMPPDLCYRLAERERSLRNVQAGPEWRPEALWVEVFGPRP